MTLGEVMVGMTVFVMCTLGIYATLIKAYQLAALSRCREEARAVLRTYADQFERLQTTYHDEVSGADYTRWLFVVEGPTGRGLEWGELSDSNTSVPEPAIAHIEVPLGTEDNPIRAKVTRQVTYLDAATGETSLTRTIQAAGYMVVGTFSVEYTLNNKDYVETLTVARAVP